MIIQLFITLGLPGPLPDITLLKGGVLKYGGQ